MTELVGAPMDGAEEARPVWSQVFAMAICVAGLLMAELLPVTLLTPIATGLRITEGMAGPAVTATAAVALVAGLVIAPATRRIDRRHVLLAFRLVLLVPRG